MTAFDLTIPPEAIEAAAIGACDAHLGAGFWGRTNEPEQNYWRAQATAALTAAMPLLMGENTFRLALPGGAKCSVAVQQKEKDGWFIFTSDDVPGLYVAHRDEAVARADIPVAISCLLKLNCVLYCKVEPSPPPPAGSEG
jgi:hypothetical protein